MRIYSLPIRSALTAILALASVDSAFAQSANPRQASPMTGYRIAGTVISKTDSRPLSHARIIVTDAKDAKKFESLITGDDGKFEFTGVPAGKYSLTGARRGFVFAAYDQHDQYSTAIVTGAGVDTENLTLRLAPDAVITGKVLDEANEPVREAVVTLYYNDHSGGVDRIHQFRSASTDDQGAYEFTLLRPGTYFVSVSATPWYAVHPPSNPESFGKNQPDAANPVDRSLDVAYPVTYYADVTDTDSATPIPVRGGDRIQADIHLTPVPALILVFHVPENGGFNIPQLQQSSFDTSTAIRSDGVQSSSHGFMAVTGIPAGRYNVRISSHGQSMQINNFDLTKDGQVLDTSAAEVMSTVKVSVKVAGETSIPDMLGIGLRSGNKFLSGLTIVDAKGQADFAEVPAGSYEVVVRGSDRRYSIAQMTAEGAQASGHVLTVAPGSSPSVSLTLARGNAEVEGVVKKAGRAFAGAMVVLVPKNPERDHDLFRRDQSDLDGTFTLHGVIPGSYTLLAIEDGWELDWSQPGVISVYQKSGRKIQVSDEAGRTMKVTDAIEVQPQ